MFLHKFTIFFRALRQLKLKLSREISKLNVFAFPLTIYGL